MSSTDWTKNPHEGCWRRDQQSQTDLLRAYEQRDELEKIIAHYRALAEAQRVMGASPEAQLHYACDAEREALLVRFASAERERYAAESERDALKAELAQAYGDLARVSNERDALRGELSSERANVDALCRAMHGAGRAGVY